MVVKTGLTRMVFGLLLVWAIPAAADGIELVNGDRITGSIGKIAGGKLYITPAYAGEFAVDVDQVRSVESSDEFQFTLSDQSVVDGRIGVEGEQSVIVTDTGTRPIDLATVQEMGIRRAHFEWNVVSDLAADVSRGNSDAETFRWHTRGFARLGDHRHTLEFTLDRKKADGVTSKEEDDFRYRYNWSFDDDWSLYALLGWQKDPIRELERRITAGGGLGYDVWDSGSRAWHMGLGLDFIDEEIGGQSQEPVAAHFLTRFSNDLFEGEVKFFHENDIYSYVAGRNNVAIETRTGFSYALTNEVAAKVQVNYDYETDPASGAENDDLQYLVGVSITLD
ncbi:MAG: DUF481 domain-containing protein [Pseudomonadales bacterium]|jgi:putative salt-induced outer membrane protein YdiY|nr:DUF481 domain-containing protein [Pseudomonadales bacterium]|tara:strand:- start:1236 stop:2243 length:1008 start_codon:yes stop_codon:yes gene_type:complete